jgi:hypothetical protein
MKYYTLRSVPTPCSHTPTLCSCHYTLHSPVVTSQPTPSICSEIPIYHNEMLFIKSQPSISPNTILITPHFTSSSDASGHLKLADFGLSKIVSPIPSSGFDPTGPVDEEDYRNASATVAINLIKSILPLKVSHIHSIENYSFCRIHCTHLFFYLLNIPFSISSFSTFFFYLCYLCIIVVFQVDPTM